MLGKIYLRKGHKKMSYNFPFAKGCKVIELGGGTRPYFRPNLDVRAAENVDIVADFNKELPIEDNEYEGIFSSFCIEHISWRKVRLFLKECFRICKDGSKAVFLTANTEEQMKYVLEHDDWEDECSRIIFGDQDYDENTHRNSMSPKYAIQLMREAGFDNIIIFPFGDLKTDIIIEGTVNKKEINNMQNIESVKFNHDYFDNPAYFADGHGTYRDHPKNWIIFNKLMEKEPQSVLELGCARGYVLRRFEQSGISGKGVDNSEHCFLTRVTDSVINHNLLVTPWPFKDQEFDICYSLNFLEHVPEKYIPAIVAEIKRVSKRSLHSINFGDNKDDQTANLPCTCRPEEWWKSKFDNTTEIFSANVFENGHLATSIPAGDEKLKLNVGSFTTMYHNGWLNMDVVQLGQWADRYQYKFVHMDARQPMRLGNDTVDLIASCHMLEHLTWDEGLSFLKECHRVMKPGAVMRVSVPDAERITNYYRKSELGMFDEINVVSAKNPCQSFKFWSLLFEGHRIAYDGVSLKKIGEEAGFKVKRCNFNEGNKQILAETFDLLPDLSIWVEFTK